MTALFLTMLLLAGCSLYSFAAAETSVVWAAQVDQDAVMYVPQAGDVTECLVGSTKCTGIRAKKLSELETPVHTLILLDNSLSIPKENRETIAKLLENLVGNRMQGELYTIATISDDIRYLCTAESDYLSLGSAIDSIEYENQDTQLTDRVYEAVQQLHEQDPAQFCRVVIVSDGVDDKQIGYTRTELENLLRSCGYPIYTVGCGSNDTAERKTRLENLFSLSRINAGQSWYLAETDDTYAIAKGICEYNDAQCITVKLPDEVCDGSVRAIQVTSGGTAYSTQLKMPFVAAASSQAASEAPAPASSAVQQPEPAPENNQKILLIALAGALVVIVLVVVAVVAAGKKKKQAQKKEEKEEAKAAELPARHGTVVVTVDDDTSDIQSTWNAAQQAAPVQPRPDPVPQPAPKPVQTDPADATVRMFGSRTPAGGSAAAPTGTPVLRMMDLNDPSRHYEIPLDGVVTIGRSASCRLVLDRPSVSHNQCEIFVQNGQVCITNRSQTNPTCVNGQLVGEGAPLPKDCVITMGNEKMKAVIV